MGVGLRMLCGLRILVWLGVARNAAKRPVGIENLLNSNAKYLVSVTDCFRMTGMCNCSVAIHLGHLEFRQYSYPS